MIILDTFSIMVLFTTFISLQRVLLDLFLCLGDFTFEYFICFDDDLTEVFEEHLLLVVGRALLE